MGDPCKGPPPKNPPLAASHVWNPETSLGIPWLCSIPCHRHPVPAGRCTPHGHPTGPAVTHRPREYHGWVQRWHQEGLGTRRAWPVLGHPSCLPQPRHALILPRPASTAAVRVISSKSLCASPLISSQELGLARPAERLLFEGTFAAALPPDAQHIAVWAPQTSQRHGAHGPYPCPKPSAVEAGGRRMGTAGQGGGGALPERQARSWSVSGTDGIVSSGKN